MSKYPHFSMIEKAFDYFFNRNFISLDPKHDSRYNYKYRVKIGNNVSEFMHSNWMTKSYYSDPKHKSLLQ